jgi:hypothetical protein
MDNIPWVEVVSAAKDSTESFRATFEANPTSWPLTFPGGVAANSAARTPAGTKLRLDHRPAADRRQKAREGLPWRAWGAIAAWVSASGRAVTLALDGLGDYRLSWCHCRSPPAVGTPSGSTKERFGR